MDRRDLLSGGAVLAAMSMLDAAAAAEEDPHAHHHAAGTPASTLALAAGDCVQKGQACLDHCLVLLGDGDRIVAACAQSVTQTMAICAALQTAGNANSKYLPRLAALAKDACRDCAAECRKHADHHAPCKDCLDSCEACARECDKLAS